MNDRERYIVAREQLRDLGLADSLRRNFEDMAEMGPGLALPLMQELITGGKDAVRRVNAVKAEIDRHAPGVGHLVVEP